MNAFDLTGKVAVITGGSGTLGTGMAKGLFNAGARVCIVGRDAARAQRAAQSISTDAERILTAEADVTRSEEVQRAVGVVIARWGRVDILVNAAGGNRPDAITNPKQSFFDLSPEAMRATF